MDVISILAPLIGVVIGSMLTGLGVFLKERHERKRIISIALAELLEIRHRLVVLDTLMDDIRKLLGLNDEACLIVRNFLETFIPDCEGGDERYNNAVSLIAGSNPVLAFSLRSKNSAPRFLAALRYFAIESGIDLKQYDMLESSLRSAIIPNVNDAAIELAKSLSWTTKRQVVKLIDDGCKMPHELMVVIEQLKNSTSSEAKL